MGISSRKYFKRDILERVNKIKLTIDEIVTLAMQSVMNIFLKARQLSVNVSLEDIEKMSFEYEYIFEKELDKMAENKLLNTQYARK